MKTWLLALVPVLCSACTMGHGKFPNPRWAPTVDTVELEAEPSTFVEGGLRFHVERLAEVDYTKYGLVREVVGRWLYYDLEVRVESATDPGQAVDRSEFSQVPFRVLDASGEELQSRRGKSVTIDQKNSTPAELVVFVRLMFDEGLPPRKPAHLAVGDRLLPLTR